MTAVTSTTVQLLFDRLCSLIVYNPPTATTGPASPATGSTIQLSQGTAQAGNGLDLTPPGASPLRVNFRVYQSDYETPNWAIIRVYNVSDQTAKKLSQEFQRVALQAGYTGANYGAVFDGTIKQVMFGHESNVDSYVDIYAADGDIAYNNAVVNTSLAAGSRPQDQLNQIQSAMSLPVGYSVDLPPTALSRGKVMFGLARDHMRRLADTQVASWSIRNGQLTLIPLSSYQPSEAVVLTAATGLVGFPQQTPGGIMMTCLLNPKIQVGTLVQIDNKSVVQGLAATPSALLYGNTRLETLPGFNAKLSDDGLYKVLVHEYDGDTRADPWYSHLTCLAVDRSAPVGDQVRAYWAGGPE